MGRFCLTLAEIFLNVNGQKEEIMEPIHFESAWTENLNKLTDMLRERTDALQLILQNEDKSDTSSLVAAVKDLVKGAKVSWKKSRKLDSTPTIGEARKNLLHQIHRATETLDRAQKRRPTFLERLLRYLAW